MKRTLARRLLALAAVAGFAGGGAIAHAAGTAAGTSISNSATVDFAVSSIPQPTVTSDPVEFVVDRLLDVDVTTQDGDAVAVAPGATGGDVLAPDPSNGAFLTFDVTNQGNDTTDLLLAAVRNPAYPDAFTAIGGAQADDPASVVGMCVEGGTPGTCGPVLPAVVGGPNPVFRLAGTAPDATTRILVVFALPASVTNGQYDAWSLVAAVARPADGAYIAADSSGNAGPDQGEGTVSDDDPGAVQDVFGDEAGSDAFNFVSNAPAAEAPAVADGQHASVSAFLIEGAELTVSKARRVVYDPFTPDADLPVLDPAGASESGSFGADTAGTFGPLPSLDRGPKAIPGAVVEYVITVENAAAGALAEAVTVTATIPAETSAGSGDEPSLDHVIIDRCDGDVEILPFGGSDTDVLAGLGDCGAGQNGTVTYYVTVD